MKFVSTFVDYMSAGLELAGVSVIVFGAIWATGKAAVSYFSSDKNNRKQFMEYRRMLGKGILLGLEFLVAADIINSVAVEPSFRSVGVLAVIVLVRTFLSFTLEVEMDGRWPWQKKPEKPAKAGE